MIKIAVPMGSQPEILALVKKARGELSNLSFSVYDYTDNIGTEADWTYVSCQDETQALARAVQAVATGEADILLKGMVQTHLLLKEVLKDEYHLKEKKLLSHVATVDLKQAQRCFLLTDAAMNIAPTKEQLYLIVENALEVAKKINLKRPKVALLSAAENYNPKMPSSVLAHEVTELFKNEEECVVYGPLSFDLALSKASATHKKFKGPIQGDADILVVPTIDTGNSLYKALALFGHALVGGTIVGAGVPIVVTSRSDSIQAKLHSLKFAVAQVKE